VRTGELFDLLRDGRPWTRAQLAEATGLARSTITARIDTLMRLGLVAPFGGARSTGGRPPALFALNPTAKVVVGVDVNATHHRSATEGYILITATPIKLGRRMTTHDVVITDEQERRICTMRITNLVIDKPKH
jgi:acyl-coenzyme A thioesterase PaaI-like protein